MKLQSDKHIATQNFLNVLLPARDINLMADISIQEPSAVCDVVPSRLRDDDRLNPRNNPRSSGVECRITDDDAGPKQRTPSIKCTSHYA
jgi:hypothetical protein